MKKTIFLFLPILFIACSPKVKSKITSQYTALAANEPVLIFDKTEAIPAEALPIGTVKIGDTGFSVDCGWDVTIEKAKEAARAAGGNVLKITEHKQPSPMGSSCDRIKAEIYKLDSNTAITLLEYRNAVVDSTWDYAKIYVYRPHGQGALIGYNLFLGDSLLCRVKNNSKHEIIVRQMGQQIIWASTETKEEVPITIEKGKVYYIRCGIGMGAFVGRPKMYVIEKAIGRGQYKQVSGR